LISLLSSDLLVDLLAFDDQFFASICIPVLFSVLLPSTVIRTKIGHCPSLLVLTCPPLNFTILNYLTINKID
jgi:hypothetical protein